jgi:hypothetical protein
VEAACLVVISLVILAELVACDICLGDRVCARNAFDGVLVRIDVCVCADGHAHGLEPLKICRRLNEVDVLVDKGRQRVAVGGHDTRAVLVLKDVESGVEQTLCLVDRHCDVDEVARRGQTRCDLVDSVVLEPSIHMRETLRRWCQMSMDLLAAKMLAIVIVIRVRNLVETSDEIVDPRLLYAF